MSEWWTYRPEDFLLFSPRVYWRMFELQNEVAWPWQLAMLALGLALVVAMALRPARFDMWIGLTLAVLWAFVGWTFVWGRYAPINWAMVYLAPAFGLQAALLLIAAIRGWLAGGSSLPQRAGLAMAATVVLLYPLLPPLFGRSLSTSEVFGMAPDPTAIATLGLALASRRRTALLLLPVPLLWLVASGLTLHTMGDAQAWAPALAVAAALAILILRWFDRRTV